ncbi:hypothetical protein LZ30DRAFT_41525 [Colletotrichum cereale]|nr:hypothetical protein LZ30DRAFT_41525 [Colletotrichum cereale]
MPLDSGTGQLLPPSADTHGATGADETLTCSIAESNARAIASTSRRIVSFGQYLTSIMGNLHSTCFPLRSEHRDPLSLLSTDNMPCPDTTSETVDAESRPTLPLQPTMRRCRPRAVSASRRRDHSSPFPMPVALMTRIHPSQVKSGAHIGTPSENSIIHPLAPESSHTSTNAFNTRT